MQTRCSNCNKQSQAELEVEHAVQFAFDEQWKALRAYCAEREIRFIGDVAIFVNFDSADVWTHPEIFELKKDLTPIRVAGVPPDYFSATGQRWGNPIYKWEMLQTPGLRLVGRPYAPNPRPLRHYPAGPFSRL